jgi:hypothetical protein
MKIGVEYPDHGKTLPSLIVGGKGLGRRIGIKEESEILENLWVMGKEGSEKGRRGPYQFFGGVEGV